MKLHVSAELALPEDAVTRTFVVYGGKGKGKTNFGSVLVEELAKRRLRFCVTDPLDVWWGLQHGRTKDEQGIDVMILGGAHGDRAIHPGAGEVLADFVADEDVSTVIVMRHADGRMWTNGERIRFMTAFVRRLFARQGERRRPLMLVVDEAGRFVPQTAGKGDIQIAECIGAIEELVEWGRNVGIGCCLITQRSARMNKSVSELAECMVAFQTAGPNSVAAIVDWFGEHIERERQKELIGILRKLPVGRALVVSPEWLDFEGEAAIRLRETFDSSATPKAGGALRAPGKARKPDLAKYEARIAEVEEQAKANDPATLRKERSDQARRIRELEAEVARLEQRPASVETEIERVEVPVLKDGEAKRLALSASKLEALTGRLEKVAASALAAAHSVHAPAVQVIGSLERVVTGGSAPSAGVTSEGRPGHGRSPGSTVAPAVRAADVRPAVREADRARAHAPAAPVPQRAARAPGGDMAARTTDGLSNSQRRILDVLAGLELAGIEADAVALGAWIGKHPRTKGLLNDIGALRSAGLVEGHRLTDAGRGLSSPIALDVDSVRQGLRGRQREILDMTLEAYPRGVTRPAIAERLGLHERTKSLLNDLGALRSRGLIDYRAGEVVARDVLFAGARA